MNYLVASQQTLFLTQLSKPKIDKKIQRPGSEEKTIKFLCVSRLPVSAFFIFLLLRVFVLEIDFVASEKKNRRLSQGIIIILKAATFLS